MSNSIGISPPVMINRIVDRAETPAAAQLTKVAELSAQLRIAAAEEQAKTALFDPNGQAKAPVIDSGAVVDRLI
ncbi:hypothetical protein GCM10007913_36360 [Devosia yakushimensis]|uniref:Uncharacterized protein n=1 Tax=Devosia yakushimensis TaxID=470028 RepID=A0ABQ5UHY4_9HYPH|nr:hypothetical protein [Devosia yakushimensis]GLQ11704.1 hypothetical protein GCM10007913_36360 [Devosia yakushimensis]